MRRSKYKGLALVTILLVLAILGLITSTIVALSSSTLVQARAEDQSQVAVYAAEAGLWRAFRDFREDPTFLGYPETDMPNAAARYRVDIIAAPGPGPRGPIPAGLHYIHAVGKSGRLGTPGASEVHEIGMMVKHTNSAYVYGLFGDQGLNLGPAHGHTYTWDSSAGVAPAGSRAGKAHVGSNGRSANSVQIGHDGYVDGNVHVSSSTPPDVIDPPLPDPTLALGFYRGRIDCASDFVMPSVDMDLGVHPTPWTAGSTFMTNGYLDPGLDYGALDVWTGDELWLLEGQTYHIDSINVHGTGKICLGSGAGDPDTNPPASRTVVKINSSLQMDPSTRIVNRSGRPDYLEIEINGATGGSSSVAGDPLATYLPNCAAYFVLKAPTIGVEFVEQRRYFGAFIAAKVAVTTGGGAGVPATEFYYDLNLANTTCAPFLPGGTGENNLMVVSYQNF